MRGWRDWALSDAAGILRGMRGQAPAWAAHGFWVPVHVQRLVDSDSRGIPGPRLPLLLHWSPYKLFHGAVCMRMHEDVVAVIVVISLFLDEQSQ